jgi:hypothetical protein
MANKFKIDTNRVKEVFADVGGRAKAAREQVASRRAELSQFNKGNVEALKESGKILASGAKPLANEAVANTRKQLGEISGSVKSLKGVKPAEAVKLQREAAKASFATARADTKAFGQSCAKLASEAAVPLKSRIAAVRGEQQAAA